MAMVFKSTRLMVEVEQIRGIHAWVYIPLYHTDLDFEHSIVAQSSLHIFQTSFSAHLTFTARCQKWFTAESDHDYISHLHSLSDTTGSQFLILQWIITCVTGWGCEYWDVGASFLAPCVVVRNKIENWRWWYMLRECSYEQWDNSSPST